MHLIVASGERAVRAAEWRRGRGALMEFHRFLIALSVRPGSCLAMSAHLVPTCCTSSMMSCSSSSVQSSLLTDGHKWLCHLRTRSGLRVMHYVIHHMIMQCASCNALHNALCNAKQRAV